MLQVIGDFNNLPQELLDSVKVLGDNEQFVYELLGGVKEEDGNTYFGASLTIPGRDRIFYKNKFYDIGVVSSVTPEGKLDRCEGYVLNGGGANGLVTPRFALSGANPKHKEWHFFFALCNYNASNKNASPATPKMFKEIDFSAEAKKNVAGRSLLKQALDNYELMSLEDMRMFVRSQNLDGEAQPDVIRDSVSGFAIRDPRTFLTLRKDAKVSTKALAKQALELGVWRWDAQTLQVKDGKTDTVIATVNRQEGKDNLDMIADWLNTSKNGQKIKEALEKRVKAAARGLLIEANKADEDDE